MSEKTPLKRIVVTGFHKESAWIPHDHEEVPLREVRKQIRITLETCIRSNREADEVIRSEVALYEIACLTRALELLKGVK